MSREVLFFASAKLHKLGEIVFFLTQGDGGGGGIEREIDATN